MRNSILFSVFLLVFLKATSQEFTGFQLLEKSIKFHDPEALWPMFKANFNVTMKSPNKPPRKSRVEVDSLKSFFKLSMDQKGNKLVSTINNNDCSLSFNGDAAFSEEIAKEFRLTCERVSMYKNYYTYLYGLPMKLKDKGAIVDSNVTQRSVNGISYWVLKTTYTPEVGSDTWYFYFDKNTYQLKRYQFFHDEAKNDGEYIILENELIVGGIKMPKDRAWYYNKDDKYLGTDYLTIK